MSQVKEILASTINEKALLESQYPDPLGKQIPPPMKVTNIPPDQWAEMVRVRSNVYCGGYETPVQPPQFTKMTPDVNTVTKVKRQIPIHVPYVPIPVTDKSGPVQHQYIAPTRLADVALTNGIPQQINGYRNAPYYQWTMQPRQIDNLQKTYNRNRPINDAYDVPVDLGFLPKDIVTTTGNPPNQINNISTFNSRFIPSNKIYS